jgi:hypothetical protein
MRATRQDRQQRSGGPPRLLGAGIALIAMVAAWRPGLASAEECTIHYPFGTASLPASDFQAGTYGADLRLLYGDWNWEDLGLDVDVIKASRYVRDVADLTRRCHGNLEYGRLDFRRRQVLDQDGQTMRDETDAEYFERIGDELVDLRREFAEIENNYDALLHQHAPLVQGSVVIELKSIVNETLLEMNRRAGNRTTGIGWIVVRLQELEEARDQFLEALTFTRELITVYLGQYPSLRDLVIDDLINNTDSVLSQYGEFFSLERQAELQVLLDAADEQREEEDLEALVASLNGIADELETRMFGMWDAGEPVMLLASRLEFIFGSCGAAPNRLLSDEFFGDLPVAERIVAEGDDAQFCLP